MASRRLLGCLVVSATTLALTATPAFAAQVVGLYHMDTASKAIDSSSFNNDGQNKSITVSGGAYSFNGTSSKVIVPDDNSLDPGAADITISLKVKFTVVPPPSVGDYDLVRKGGPTYYKIEITNQGKARCQFHGSSAGGGLVFGPNLADGSWHTITCSKTSTQIKGTVDGSSASRSIRLGSISNGTPLVFGGKSSGTEDLYKGLMDEVKIQIG